MKGETERQRGRERMTEQTLDFPIILITRSKGTISRNFITM